MTDGHIHIEAGPYTPEWIDQFVAQALKAGLTEIRLLEHCYRFREFAPMYDSVEAYSPYASDWVHRRVGVFPLSAYLELIDRARQREYPITVKFGLEICYFREQEKLIAAQTAGRGFDFLLGSIHFVDAFPFDHKPELWNGLDVDSIYKRYFEDSVCLARSGLFDGIGHPDTIKLFGHRPSYPLTDQYEALAQALAQAGMYADLNSGAARRYPQTATLGIEPEFLRILKRYGVPLITSSDAHCPQDVGSGIRELLKQAGMEPQASSQATHQPGKPEDDHAS